MILDGWDANFVFIACPNSAKHDPWTDELSRFCPWLKQVVVGNTATKRNAAMAQAQAYMDTGTPFAMICHYEAIPLIEGKNKRGWLKLGQWDLVVVDEAHNFISRQAKRTAALRRLERAGILFLSGSVMSGRAEDLFVPWNMAQKKRYPSQWASWNDRFLEVIEGDHGRVVVGPKLHRLSTFKSELGEILTIRKAADHLSVPEPIVVDHSVKLHPEQMKAYRQVVDELMAELPDGTTLYTVDGAPLRTACRRVTGGVPMEDGSLRSAKLDRADQLINGAGDSQVLVFSWHKNLAVEMVRRCREKNLSAGLINGDVPLAKREKVIDLYKRGGYSVLCATIKTLSAAANLQNTGVVIFVEESDDPIDNEQAIGRAVRQGQPAHVSVHRIRAEDTVDDLSVLPNALTKAELRKLILGS